jgi:hypothetical protein
MDLKANKYSSWGVIDRGYNAYIKRGEVNPAPTQALSRDA